MILTAHTHAMVPPGVEVSASVPGGPPSLVVGGRQGFRVRPDRGLVRQTVKRARTFGSFVEPSGSMSCGLDWRLLPGAPPSTVETARLDNATGSVLVAHRSLHHVLSHNPSVGFVHRDVAGLADDFASSPSCLGPRTRSQTLGSAHGNAISLGSRRAGHGLRTMQVHGGLVAAAPSSDGIGRRCCRAAFVARTGSRTTGVTGRFPVTA